MPFATLGLRPEIADAVAAKGYTTPSPIQAKAIPAILAGHDVLGGAQTGTGKTAAFSLPLLHRLSQDSFKHKRPRALVLAPTRELAAQVHQSILDYGNQLNLRSGCFFGGVNINPQITALRRGIDILVATPGRLLDLCQRGEAQLGAVETLVLDEADRMLDMGFIHDIRKILKLLPTERQNLFFSATYAAEVKKLADSILRNPVEVEVAPRNSTADQVHQEAYSVGQKNKRSALAALIKDGDWQQTLVFTRTKHGANRLAKQLESDGITAAAIHGNKSQSARERALEDFKTNYIRVLVATDIAARGIDIVNLPHVVNYELPNVPEDYVHRIGRTGRAGKQGTAISLVSSEEEAYLVDIERLLKREISLRELSPKGVIGKQVHRIANPPKPKKTQQSNHPRPKPNRGQPAGQGGEQAGGGANKRRRSRRPRGSKPASSGPRSEPHGKPQNATSSASQAAPARPTRRNRRPRAHSL
ncbi:DEAD/DEAH box helicase [Pelagicoccus sp. SDUM812003]|uniref:DEAD/DEAH box helicase n=1 Tax=Pelagicoccus sp. SDUM812003 TaxID=3041267 RepID=UPI00280FD71D|nr:DEAD/DEAH box helicase [Pelagicoccus sp. SDUM812003]MDQ8201747.1 DEAD/DEAH box helicase [Pelagicoccus sp. SDUM812003]